MTDLHLSDPLPELPRLLSALRATARAGGRVAANEAARNDPALMTAVSLTRLELVEAGAETAAGVIDGWDAVAAAARIAGVPVSANGWCAFNPAPLARRAVVRLAARAAIPPAVVADDGSRHPTQTDGDGVLVGLPIGALQSVALSPHGTAVAGCRWEVTERVLDNGRVRAELDDAGAVVRLCIDGVFAALAAPISTGIGRTRVRVAERGPVRARLLVEGERGTVAWELLAHDDQLRAVVLAGGSSMALAVTGSDGAIGAGAGRARRLDDETWCRWCEAVPGDGAALLAIAADRPLRIRPTADGAQLETAAGTTLALRVPTRRGGSTAVMAASLALPPVPAGAPAPAALRLVEPGTLAPLGLAPVDGAFGELLLAEGRGASGRSWLFPRGGVRAAWRVDGRGAELAPLPLTAEGDGIELAYAAGDVLLVRWR